MLRDDRALIGIAVIQVDESFFDVTVYPLIQCYKFGCLGETGSAYVPGLGAKGYDCPLRR